MPYKNIKDVPEKVKKHLPEHGQKIYMEAFNNAWNYYQDPSKRKYDASLEETAHRIAWSAVEQKYFKDENGNWQERK